MSTFMTESYDAPMTDAGDNDVSMYPTLATADSWLSVEGSMGDDGFPSNSATVDYAQAGVEVEMGDDVEIIEYEMADEGGDYGGQEGLQDIEVYDISEFSSSLPVERHPYAGAYGGVETEFTSVPSFEGPLPQSHTTPVVTSDAVVAFKVDEATSTHTTSHSTLRSDAAGTHHDAAHTGIAAVPDTEEPVLETNQADGGGVASEALATTPFQTEPPVDEAAELEDSSHERTGLEPSGEPLIPEKPGVADQGEYADLERTNPSASDPHEISEGVYIDPPPPVLLSLPPFAEFSECSLFNLPTSSSLSQSPSSSVKSGSGDPLHLMLHDRPILYYEPLSAVFTALRQEPCIQRMPGFSEAELVLDAYELQLSISEDNIYTHEVTLHELNVIHDGSDLSGPLRLRLKVHIPRFVARYTTLRDQIARLNLTGDGDGTHTDDILGDRQYEPDYDARHEPEEEDTHTEGGVIQEMQKNAEPQSGQGGHEADDLHSADADAVQEQVEATAATEDGEHGAVDSDVAAEDDGVTTETEAKFQVLVDEPTEEPETEFEESVDADEVHQPVVEEGGDYVDHAEFQDDENQYGEDLPEDFGGNAEEDADYQATATPISFEQDQVEQRYEEVPAGADGEEERHESTGLHVNGDTDTLGHSNSIEGGLSGGRSSNSEVREQDNIQNADDQCAFHQENVVITVDDDGIGLNDNWDDAEDKVVAKEDRPEALSRKSSTTTLASRSSKRGYEEVDLDDFDDEDFNTAPSSPDTKRLRVQ